MAVARELNPRRRAESGPIGVIVIVALLIVATLTGLVRADTYGDPPEVVEMFRGYDLVTLVVIVPMLLIAALPSWRSSPRAQLFCAGALAYSVYNYALYVFGAEFGDLFLVHIAVFSASLSALIASFRRMDVSHLASTFRDRTPALVVAVLLGLLAFGLGAMWVVGSIGFAVTGDVPEEGSQLILPTVMTHLAYALDLGVLVPGYGLAAVLLWRRHPWGYVLATVLLVAGAVHQLSYMSALVFQERAQIAGATAFDPIEPFVLAVYLVAIALLLANVRNGRAHGRRLSFQPS